MLASSNTYSRLTNTNTSTSTSTIIAITTMITGTATLLLFLSHTIRVMGVRIVKSSALLVQGQTCNLYD
jgi:hypothetical protein